MKRIVALFVILCLTALPASSIGRWSKNPAFQFGQYQAPQALQTFLLDSAFVYGTSGDGFILTFNSPVAQTTSALTIYVYCSAIAGTPSSSSIDIYASQTNTAGDAQRPPAGASPIASSGNTDASGCGTASWLTYSITSVTLAVGQWYFAIIKNDTATPTSNSFTVTSGSALGMLTSASSFNGVPIRSGTTTDGITTDPSMSGRMAPAVIKFSDGTVYGAPYVASANSANDSNYRGNRFTFDEDVIISAIDIQATFTLTTTVTIEVYNGASQLTTTTADVYTKGNGATVFFAAPVTFPGGTAIDVVMKPSVAGTNGTYVTNGTSPPTDVQTAFGQVTYVTGATPGSFTETTTRFIPMTLTIDTNPAISGGGACIIGG